LLGGNAGQYYVVVSNVWGSATSAVAVLSVQDPWITVQPIDQEALPGHAVMFSVAAIGTPPLAYQWQFNGTNIAGSERVLTLQHGSSADEGSYRVLFSNSFSSVTSAPAVLTVSVPAWGLRRRLSVVESDDSVAWVPANSASLAAGRLLVQGRPSRDGFAFDI